MWNNFECVIHPIVALCSCPDTEIQEVANYSGLENEGAVLDPWNFTLYMKILIFCSPHPYIFFNPDQTSMTFLGFTVDPRNGNLMNQTGQVLEGAIMKRSLYRSLAANGAPLSEDFDMLPR